MKKTIMITILLTLFIVPFTTLSLNMGNIDYPAGYVPYYNEVHAVALAKLVWAEGRGCSIEEQAAIMWCVINRVEHDTGWSDRLMDVLTAKGQFAYYASSPVTPELYELAKDVLIRWDMERCGYEDVGRTLPINYYYFTGDGERNHFRANYSDKTYWDWSLPNPYE